MSPLPKHSSVPSHHSNRFLEAILLSAFAAVTLRPVTTSRSHDGSSLSVFTSLRFLPLSLNVCYYFSSPWTAQILVLMCSQFCLFFLQRHILFVFVDATYGPSQQYPRARIPSVLSYMLSTVLVPSAARCFNSPNPHFHIINHFIDTDHLCPTSVLSGIFSCLFLLLLYLVLYVRAYVNARRTVIVAR